MRILQTTDYYPPHLGGGVEVVVSEVSRRLVGRGHDVQVVTLDSEPVLTLEEREGVVVRRVPALGLNRLTGLELRISRSIRREVRRAAVSFNPDVIHAHHMYFMSTPAALAAAREMDIPAVLTLHVGGMSAFGGWRGRAARFYEGWIGKRLLERADVLVAVSEAVALSVPGHLRDRVVVIPNGVDANRFKPHGGRSPKMPGAVFVGRLIQNKGPDRLLAAFARVTQQIPSARLAIVGDGPLRSRLEQMVVSRGLTGSVEFLGMRSDIQAILPQYQVFVRPSLVEGMPLTVLEAMASGLPVVATDVGGVREVVEHEVTGLVVPPGSEDMLVEALCRVLSDPHLRERMGSAGRERAERSFSWEKTTLETEGLLSRVAGVVI